MARIEDEIGRIQDTELRKTLLEEVRKLKEKRQFGLVFEEHLPEVVPINSASVRPRARVAQRTTNLTETYYVRSVNGRQAELVKDADGRRETLPVKSLVVIKRFGEPIYPALAPMGKVENGGNAPYHTLIEADNYHALQLLEYLYAGKVDCIYIDPPYNTGARDWKYNNDYVDRNDAWRHSKWLAMIKRRFEFAVRLLKPTGILCITIDDHEGHRLKCLLEDYFPGFEILGTAVIKNNPAGRSTTRGFSVCHEYAVFVARSPEATISRLDRTPEQIARYKERDELGWFEWANFRKHGGVNTYRATRPRQFYPIYVKGDRIRIPDMTWNDEKRKWDVHQPPELDELVLWPINDRGEERIWDFGADTVRASINHLKVKSDAKGNVAIYRKWRLNGEGLLPQTWWDKSLYSAAEHGTNLLTRIFDDKHVFPFPKSKYAVRECLRVAGAGKPNALILDFFAGSGTTLHAVLELNAADGGNRQCILVTNNEVSEEEAKTLTQNGLQPGHPDWGKHGICRSVTFPRCKYTILGKRNDGTPLPGEYLTGRIGTKEELRNIKQLGFVEGKLLTLQQRKQLVALIDGAPQSKIMAEQAFFMEADSTASILFDATQVDTYLKALEEQEHITDFYIVTQDNRLFNRIKQEIQGLLGPVLVEEEEKCPLSQGFPANLEYFKLDFLDPNEVAMGRQFEAILPILWMMAGAKDKRPKSNGRSPYLIPTNCPFAVLLQEKRFAEFREKIKGRNDLTHIFLVTNSEDAFFEMKKELDAPHIVMLYKNYLENFKLNISRELGET